MRIALLKLILLQTRGFFRRLTRGARSPRGAIFLVLGIAVMVLWLGPAIFTSLAMKNALPGRHRSPEELRAFVPLALLAVCLLTIISSAGDKAISFTPGEVDVLFPGPFTRRQLLGYKLLKSALIALLTSLIISIAMLPAGSWWLASYVGIVLALIFVQLFSTAGVMLGQAISERAFSLARRAVLVGAIVIFALLARHWLIARGGLAGIYDFRDSPAGHLLLAPFMPFGEVMAAYDLPDLAHGAISAAGVDACLLVLVLLLDQNYLEAAMSASRRRYAHIQRVRSGALLSLSRGKIGWHLPQLPWTSGAGPIAWRQATIAARSAKGLVLLLLAITIAIGPLFGASLHSSWLAPNIIVGALAWSTVLLSGLIKFDFRGDLDHMEVLKALPLAPIPLSIGQLIVPTLLLTGAHIILLGSVAAFVREHRDVLLVAAVLALPFNALLMATENLIFLLFPTRPAAVSPGDFQLLGRQAAQLAMKAMSVMAAGIVAFGVAVPLFVLTRGSLVVLTVVAGAALSAEACGLVPLIAWAYRRFDPSTDTPA